MDRAAAGKPCDEERRECDPEWWVGELANRVAADLEVSPDGHEHRTDSGERSSDSNTVRQVPARLEYVDPSKSPGWFSRTYAAFSNTRPGRFLSVKVVWRVDPFLMRVTGGRLGLDLTIPTALLETRGAKSGAPRRNVVIYFHDGERVTIIASKLGFEKHPAWFHNLRANPEVRLGGVPMLATVISDEAERERLWALADQVFAPYVAYRERAAKANRTIPIVQLSPR
jgi:deazaflavin-dependent oxidoreductase (nitroreductase family)